ncbi:SAM-dependent methyltransferase [Marmoricola sp. URHA0025 HA25]
MSLAYEIAYRVGITPWEKAGEAAAEQFSRLLDHEEESRTRPLGRALDLGCGTGTHTVELAGRGWSATGIDAVERAVDKARGRAGGSGAEFVVGDVTNLAAAGLTGPVDFFLDVGCFHGLDDDQRAATGRGITALATDAATLLVLAFRPGRRPVLPRGAGQDDLERAFHGWQVLATEPADTTGMPGPLKKTAPQWFRLARVSR